MGKNLQLILIFTLVVLSNKADGRSKFRCARCKPKGLYKEAFAYVTRMGRGPDKIRLNQVWFQRSKCEEEGRTFDPFSRECLNHLEARDCKACNKPVGFKIPHERAGRNFYMCQDGVAYEFECLGNMRFNRYSGTCGNAVPTIDPEDVDDSYTPGSVYIVNEHGSKMRLFTGMQFNHKPDIEKKKTYSQS
ncbi:unnamed protein product [Allacma fusca]|uniref:Chitin-binding type-2 domain-containing protein n=1 Tax=Allacma fusca TaxID=39272 RepID=A0A8J2JHX7_9HEXA|nr:unnamed protein product [Allacma fusca]